MGVLGLTSFVDDHPQFLHDHKLHKTPVVIDGNNLVYYLYFRSHTDCDHGGDYDRYASVVEFFLDILEACEVKPYVVFDGAHNEDDSKLATVLKRASGVIGRACGLGKGRRRKGGSVLPLLAHDVFLRVLQERGVAVATCDFEADEEIAALAIDLKCPVISNDSDFYVFNLPGGFIPIDYLSWDKHDGIKDSGERFSYLSVQLYHVDNFLCPYPDLTHEHVVVFAAICGNDYITCDMLDPFYSHLASSKRKGSRRDRGAPKKKSRIEGLLEWLHSVKSISEAIEKVVGCFSQNQKAKLRHLLQQVTQSYAHPNCSVSFAAGFREPVEGSIAIEPSVKEKIRRGLVSPRLLNVSVHQRNILMCPVEDPGLENSFECSSVIRSCVYSLLKPVSWVSCDFIVAEYKRIGKNLAKSNVCCPQELEGYQISPQLPAADSRLLVNCTVDVPFLCPIDETASLFLLSIARWIRFGKPRPNEHFVRSLLVTALKLSIVDPLKEMRDIEGDEVRFLSIFGELALSKAAVKQTYVRMRKLLEKPKSRHFKFSFRVVHMFSQWQSCLQALLWFNTLLDYPYPNVNPATLFNGSFAYCLQQDLSSRKVPDLFISELLGRDGPLDRLYGQLMAWVRDLPGSNDLERCEGSAEAEVGEAREMEDVGVAECEGSGVIDDDVESDSCDDLLGKGAFAGLRVEEG